MTLSGITNISEEMWSSRISSTLGNISSGVVQRSFFIRTNGTTRRRNEIAIDIRSGSIIVTIDTSNRKNLIMEGGIILIMSRGSNDASAFSIDPTDSTATVTI